jgi:hypothetical protein
LYNREPTLETYAFNQKTRDLKQLQDIISHDFLTPQTTSCEEMAEAEACDQNFIASSASGAKFNFFFPQRDNLPQILRLMHCGCMRASFFYGVAFLAMVS